MEEDIKDDLASIAFSCPFFSDIIKNSLNYIEQLEKEKWRINKMDLLKIINHYRRKTSNKKISRRTI